jgi:hypothetical protein
MQLHKGHRLWRRSSFWLDSNVRCIDWTWDLAARYLILSPERRESYENEKGFSSLGNGVYFDCRRTERGYRSFWPAAQRRRKEASGQEFKHWQERS